jgi:VIT1/CCC1 family predicted Fe2+/Mn2+ transporter
MDYNARNNEIRNNTGIAKKAKAYTAFASLFGVLVLILWFGSQLHGWKLWLAILTSVLFAIWAGATVGNFLSGNGKTAK